MDLPPPQHSLQGPKPPHDFLSLYDSANPTNLEQRSEQENRLRLTTHDFLQPLERGAKKNEISSSQGVEVSSRVETSVTGAAVSSVDRILPGGMGTYSISHISSYSQTNGKTDIPVAHANGIESKPETTTAPFTLWDERLQAGDPARISDTLAASSKELLEKSGYWPSVRPKAELSFHGKTPFNFSTVETSHQSLAISTKARPATSQGLAEMMKSAKHASEDEDEDEEEYVERIRDKRKESSTQKVDNTLKAEGKANEQKANTPRSKHSATEQRRRSKINDRFQMLRGLVPHSDQKRDKASFLLEVIEYIQVLQEKVRKYEANEQAWNQEKKKAAVWDMCKRSPGRDVPTESSRIITGTLLDSKQSNELGDSLRTMRSSNAIHNNELPAVSTEKPSNSHLPCNRASPVISGYSSSYNEDSSCCFNKSIPPSFLMQQSAYHNFGRGFLHPTHPKGQALPLQQGSGCNGGTIQKESNAMQPVPKVEPQHPRTYFNPLVSQTETEAVSRQLHSVPCSLDQRTGEMYPGRGEQEELVIQGGVINISSVYSQGLLDTLTQALKSSGLDLSQANVSVQIDLGRRDGASTALANVKGGSQNIEDSLQNCQSQSPTKVSSTVSETEPPHKRPKTEKNP